MIQGAAAFFVVLGFELLTPIEKEDLERLRTDRHRCAHPSRAVLQRIWSPGGVAAGHDPCVPTSGVYFNASPDREVLGLAVGQSAVVDLSAFSDAPTANWTGQAIDYAVLAGATSSVFELAIDHPTVNNGAHAKLTIHLTGTPGSPTAPRPPTRSSPCSRSLPTTRATPGPSWCRSGSPRGRASRGTRGMPRRTAAAKR